MKASDVLRLHAWVVGKKQWIQMEQPRRRIISNQAAEDLGCKVSDNATRDVLVACGIQTKRQGKQKAEITALSEQVRTLTRILQKLLSASAIPEWLNEELKSEAIGEELKAAIEANCT